MLRRLHSRWKKLGPGLITGASDDDPSGIATYSQAGAGFGLSTLWTAFITYPLMYAVQEICARIGIMTSSGLAGVIKNNYSPLLLYLLLLLIFPAIIFNIAADIAGMSAVSTLLIPEISPSIFALAYTIILILSLWLFNYKAFARILKWLCFTLFVYVLVPFTVKIDWYHVLWSTFLPTIEWNRSFISILVAILGTTISPYLFFWQSDMVVEDQEHKLEKLATEKIREVKTDVNTGMFVSNLVMYFIILTTASVLYNGNIKNIETVEQAAQALKPLAGEFAFLLFALGVVGTGLIAIPVLSGCLGYIFADILDLPKGMDKKFKDAPSFYTVIFLSLLSSFVINLLRIDPIKSLIYTAIAYGLIAPFLIFIIMRIGNDKRIMRGQTNPTHINILAGIAFALMSLSAIALIFLNVIVSE